MPEPREPLKWRGDEESLIPCRLLSGVCLLIGTIHFIASHFKADFVLITLIVICFAPWLGHVFQSIGKDGVTYRGVEQGKAPSGPPESSPDLVLPAGATSQTEEEPPRHIRAKAPPEGASSAGTVDSTLRPGDLEFNRAVQSRIAQELAARSDPPFDTLSSDGKKILATLWKNQRKYYPSSVNGRWTFIVNTAASDYLQFARGMVALAAYGFVGFAGNGQLALTDSGLEYCQRHPEIANWPITYDQFDN